MPEDNISHSGLKFEFVPEYEDIEVSDLNSDRKFLFFKQDAVTFYYFVKKHLNHLVT